MKTIEEKVKVMQRYANGGEIEFSAGGSWHNLYEPQWNWRDLDYRIKKQKKTVTIEKWLYKHCGFNNEYRIVETSMPNKILGKVKLLDTYEVEID